MGFVAVTVMVTGPISAGCDRAPKLIEPVHVPEPALVSEPEPEVVPATQVNFTDVTDPVTFAEMPMTAVKHPGATSTAVGDRVTDVTTGAGTTVDVDGFVVGGLVVGLVAGGESSTASSRSSGALRLSAQRSPSTSALTRWALR